jgi:hypothetical protein
MPTNPIWDLPLGRGQWLEKEVINETKSLL